MKIAVVTNESVRASVNWLEQAQLILSPAEGTATNELLAQMRHAKRLIEHATLELTSGEIQG
jgi:hypothetical protein